MIGKHTKRQIKNILALLFFASLAGLFLLSLGKQEAGLAYLKIHLDEFKALCEVNWLSSYLLFSTGYVLYIGLFLPISTLLSLAAGAVFGFWPGLASVWLGRTLGSLLAYGISRYFLRENAELWLKDNQSSLDKLMRKDGANYLFILRVIPAMPFNATNLAMGLTRMKAWTFLWVTGLGIIPRCALLVNAGNQLAGIESLKDIASPSLILSLAALALAPLVLKKLLPRLFPGQNC